MVALNIREQTVAEAINLGVELIIVKHPLIFSKLSTLLASHFQEKIILDCIRNGINVYVSHTNIDIINGGLNDYFCDKLGIQNTKVLFETDGEFGNGRVGMIEPVRFLDFAAKVKQVFDLSQLTLVAHQADNPIVERIAICGGSGGKFYPEAIAKGAEVYITGDIYYHTAHDMLSQNLLAIDPGHHIEQDFIPLVAGKLEDWKQALDWQIDVIQTSANTNPFVKTFKK
jgi:dinuclear metal center YbgI/SA1388 family protein